MNKKEYAEYVKKKAKKSPIYKNCAFAFLIGGAICTLGQGLKDIYFSLTGDEKITSSLVCISLIFLSVLLTGIGVYDNIARFAGAGTLVPITGFANGVASCAIEFQKEGQVFGIGCQIFRIAGPVILYGIFSSWLLGVIYWVLKLFGVV